MIRKFVLNIDPAIPPVHRHKLEDALKLLGYEVTGGGQMVDGSSSDISFRKEISKRQEPKDARTG